MAVDEGDETPEGEDTDDLKTEIDALRDELDDLEASIEDRTVHRTEIEGELRRYVRYRQRRGYARGWGPYLVLLYGVILTLGAFYLLPSGWAILAMIVIWLSTLGLYVFMLVTGVTLRMLGSPRTLLDRYRSKK